jgi:rhamnose utilization protein RhaD (predicted bifunctional aldolase and dehydrogenase)
MSAEGTNLDQIREALLGLSHELGHPGRGWAILGEGNTSARIDADRFFVKASGSNLGSLRPEDIVECRVQPLFDLLRRRSATDEQINAALYECRIDSSGKKPSVEAIFHAYLLSLPGAEFVGHTHATAVNKLLCSPRAKQFATRRIFPDEVVCCGIESLYIPYVDPGLKLAQSIQRSITSYHQRKKIYPRVILLQNHGIITFGRSTQAVLAAMMMADKAATIWLGASALGGPVFMPRKQVERIAHRLDEEVRRREMKI